MEVRSLYRELLKFVTLLHVLLSCLGQVKLSLRFDNGQNYSVIEGDSVELLCHGHSNVSVTMFLDANEDKKLIQDGMHKVDQTKYGYRTEPNGTGFEHTLLLRNISRNDGGVYHCFQGSFNKSLILTVVHRPSKPVCNRLQDTIFTRDEITRTVSLQCSVDDGGNPKSKLHFQDSFTKDRLTESPICREQGSRLEASIPFLLSVYTNHTEVSCIVDQAFPLTDNIPSYQDNCSFPSILFYEELDLWLTPTFYVLTHPGNVTYTCTSNIGPLVNVSWIITSDVANGITYFVEGNRLTFFADPFTHSANTSISFECSVVITNMSTRVKSFLYIISGKGYEEIDSTFLMIVVIFPSCVLVIFLISLLVYFVYGQKLGCQLEVSDTKEPIVAINFTINDESEVAALRNENNLTLPEGSFTTSFEADTQKDSQDVLITNQILQSESSKLSQSCSKRSYEMENLVRIDSVNKLRRKGRFRSLTIQSEMQNENNVEAGMCSNQLSETENNGDGCWSNPISLICDHDGIELFELSDDVYQGNRDEV